MKLEKPEYKEKYLALSEQYSFYINELESLAQQVVDIKNPKDVQKLRITAMNILHEHF